MVGGAGSSVLLVVMVDLGDLHGAASDAVHDDDDDNGTGGMYLAVSGRGPVRFCCRRACLLAAAAPWIQWPWRRLTVRKFKRSCSEQSLCHVGLESVVDSDLEASSTSTSSITNQEGKVREVGTTAAATALLLLLLLPVLLCRHC